MAPANGELIKMLSDEVSRLRTAVETKRKSQVGVAPGGEPPMAI
jgi:hypothetical protein